jgi:hypothetical protein
MEGKLKKMLFRNGVDARTVAILEEQKVSCKGKL